MPRAQKYDGAVYRRAGTKIWWIRYRDRKGIARRESSLTAGWQEASKKDRTMSRGLNNKRSNPMVRSICGTSFASSRRPGCGSTRN
jgi:hypothetical protein